MVRPALLPHRRVMLRWGEWAARELPKRLTQEFHDHHGIEQASGVRVAGLDPDGPAARAGLEPGDVLVSLDGRPVGGVDNLVRLLTEEQVGRPTEAAVLRGVDLKRFSVVPVERG